MKKLLIISGLTATGKTSIAFLLGKKFNGELVSADSRQVYNGMDVVTGKDLPISNIKYEISKIQIKDKKLEPRFAEGILVWMIDLVEPDETYNVVDYYEQAWLVINDIWERGRLPIIVGGTGFYIKALLDGIGTMGIRPDWELREQLEIWNLEQLQKQLQKVDIRRWEKMNESDRKNPRRLIRAIEIAAKVHPRVHLLSQHHLGGGRMDSPEVNLLWIGLTTSLPKLYQRIDQRVDERVREGAVEETKRLAEKYGWDVPSITGQGYRELRGYIDGEISLEEAVKRWKFAEHEYARKQITWFKKERRIIWFDITEPAFEAKVEEKVSQWYTSM